MTLTKVETPWFTSAWLDLDWSMYPSSFMNLKFTTGGNPTMHLFVILYGNRALYQTLAPDMGSAITRFEKESYSANTGKFTVYRLTDSKTGLSFEGEFKFIEPRRGWTPA